MTLFEKSEHHRFLSTYRTICILQKIPVAFCKHLKGCNQEHAILRKSDKKWQVKVNGRLLDEGWAIFAKENDLQLGDCLIFRHEGDFEFEVSIFGSNHFERVYEQTPKGGEEINHTCNKIISQGLVFVLCFSSLVFYFNYTSKFFELLQIVHKSISLIASSLSCLWSEHSFASLYIWIIFALLTLSKYFRS